MSIKDVSFYLSPSEKGYTLTMDFPSLGTHKEIPFTVSQLPEKGATFDLYSQNGKVGENHALSFFEHRDVKSIKSAVKLPWPKHEGKMQTLVVVDLKDHSGTYGDAEAIRQSGTDSL